MLLQFNENWQLKRKDNESLKILQENCDHFKNIDAFCYTLF